MSPPLQQEEGGTPPKVRPVIPYGRGVGAPPPILSLIPAPPRPHKVVCDHQLFKKRIGVGILMLKKRQDKLVLNKETGGGNAAAGWGGHGGGHCS